MAIEVNPALATQLARSGLAGTVRCADILQCSADIAHIKHALTMLKPGGRQVAPCANGPRQNASLRQMVETRGGEWEDLAAADVFKEEGSGVRVALTTMQG